ncbi:MAG: radical SAM family heme chaperone HemW [Bdellovibrionales bacterium]|nr:radical SAM family heme chaperone HemW [Bdellovibrionales bacterium]
MALSLYVHIPYCIQRCHYCDFTTFEQSLIMPPEDYVKLLLMEMRQRHHGVAGRKLRSIYFGGGTPSLIKPSLIVSILKEVATLGFEIDQSTEVTIEINPATVSESSLDTYIQNGINRFSVGAQTFNDDLLKMCGREHTAAQTRETLSLLQKRGLNYTFDLLFALPGQKLAQLEQDLNELVDFQPKHLSAYYLTVPTGHPMSKGRPPENEQVSMFELIESHLGLSGFERYEISNFCQPGFESRHNMSYWDNTDFWGLGLSAHSYLKSSKWGTRFWNPKTFPAYEEQVSNAATGSPEEGLPDEQVEVLKMHESLTDICHMHLRTLSGLPERLLNELFDGLAASEAASRLNSLVTKGWLVKSSQNNWSLSPEGLLLSNQVFEELTFGPSDF